MGQGDICKDKVIVIVAGTDATLNFENVILVIRSDHSQTNQYHSLLATALYLHGQDLIILINIGRRYDWLSHLKYK